MQYYFFFQAWVFKPLDLIPSTFLYSAYIQSIYPPGDSSIRAMGGSIILGGLVGGRETALSKQQIELQRRPGVESQRVPNRQEA